MTHGKNAEAVQRQCELQGLPIERWPRFLLDRPELLPGLDLFFEAFISLCSCRSVGMEAGQIPMTATLAYAAHYGFDDETTDLLLTHISKMDEAYLRYHQDKRPAEAGRSGTGERHATRGSSS